MEYPNYYFDGYNNTPQQEPKPPKRGIGGYVVTAIIFTIIGALLATIFMPAVLASYMPSADNGTNNNAPRAYAFLRWAYSSASERYSRTRQNSGA